MLMTLLGEQHDKDPQFVVSSVCCTLTQKGMLQYLNHSLRAPTETVSAEVRPCDLSSAHQLLGIPSVLSMYSLGLSLRQGDP